MRRQEGTPVRSAKSQTRRDYLRNRDIREEDNFVGTSSYPNPDFEEDQDVNVNLGNTIATNQPFQYRSPSPDQ
jgi:hypothetical protein